MRRHLTAIQGHKVKVCTEAPDGNSRTFTAISIDRNTGYSLQCFSEVGIGEITDIFRRNRINNARGVALGVHRTLKA